MIYNSFTSTHEHRLQPANKIAAISQGILKAEVNFGYGRC